jgi:Mycothiol maleylpyruvate isomerase N-terminal domain
MTTAHGTVPATAEEVRALNRDLDARLLAIATSLDADLHPAGTPGAAPDPAAEPGWSAFQVLAHVAEFTRFFSAHFLAWKADPGATVGRTMENETRLAAVARARVDRLGAADLVAELRTSLAELERSLERLEDGDIEADTINAKYGTEPLSAFLNRYVVGHKAAHVEQLGALLEDER